MFYQRKNEALSLCTLRIIFRGLSTNTKTVKNIDDCNCIRTLFFRFIGLLCSGICSNDCASVIEGILTQHSLQHRGTIV